MLLVSTPLKELDDTTFVSLGKAILRGLYGSSREYNQLTMTRSPAVFKDWFGATRNFLNQVLISTPHPQQMTTGAISNAPTIPVQATQETLKHASRTAPLAQAIPEFVPSHELDYSRRSKPSPYRRFALKPSEYATLMDKDTWIDQHPISVTPIPRMTVTERPIFYDTIVPSIPIFNDFINTNNESLYQSALMNMHTQEKVVDKASTRIPLQKTLKPQNEDPVLLPDEKEQYLPDPEKSL